MLAGTGEEVRGQRASKKTRYRPCTCEAYDWPHRPGGGLCRWPLPPEFALGTLAGTHSPSRLRPPRDYAGVIPEGGELTVTQKLIRAGRK